MKLHTPHPLLETDFQDAPLKEYTFVMDKSDMPNSVAEEFALVNGAIKAYYIYTDQIWICAYTR